MLQVRTLMEAMYLHRNQRIAVVVFFEVREVACLWLHLLCYIWLEAVSKHDN